MKVLSKRKRWRVGLLIIVSLFGAIGIAYLLWSPGKEIRDGRHDLRTNGIWLQHGWLGDDGWFDRYEKDRTLFRDTARIKNLAVQLRSHGMRYVFPHLCPCDVTGSIAPVDAVQTELFLDSFEPFEVIPWVGGVLGVHCFPDSIRWRDKFVSSVVELLESHPRLSGVQINIEPLPTGNSHFLILLEELREAIPPGKIISVAAYPPPTIFHPYPDVHWDQTYFRKVAQRVDQVVPMMYDTALISTKIYQNLMSDWTTEVLEWSGSTQVLLGIPAYEDAGVGYHHPSVENLSNALLGIHSALFERGALPENYAGVAIYSEWEMNDTKWSIYEKEFEARR